MSVGSGSSLNINLRKGFNRFRYSIGQKYPNLMFIQTLMKIFFCYSYGRATLCF